MRVESAPYDALMNAVRTWPCALMIFFLLCSGQALAWTPALYTQVDAGFDATCAVKPSGQVDCWGNNDFGQLGNGTVKPTTSTVTVRDVRTAVAVSVGQGSACALLRDARVWCWGDDPAPQPAGGGPVSSGSPREVHNLGPATGVSVGANTSCALLSDGGVSCWGESLDPTSTRFSALPVPVKAIRSAVAVRTGMTHACALLDGGRVECWGSNTSGQLGNGSWKESSTPAPVLGVTDATAIAVGQEGPDNTCALLRSGAVKCWGSNFAGQLGDGSRLDRNAPVGVKGVQSARAITAGAQSACALLGDGTTACWGDNEQGQLAGAFPKAFSPVPVPGPVAEGVTAIDAGHGYACVLVAGGAVGCWGALAHADIGRVVQNGYVVNVPVTCPRDGIPDCAGSMDLRRGTRGPGPLAPVGDLLGNTKYKVRAGTTVMLALTLSRPTRALVMKRHKLRAWLELRSGRVEQDSRDVTLRASCTSRRGCSAS